MHAASLQPWQQHRQRCVACREAGTATFAAATRGKARTTLSFELDGGSVEADGVGDGSERRPPRPCAKLRSTWPETPAAVTRGRREVRLLGAVRRKLREGVWSDYYVIGLGKYVFSPTCERNGSEREEELVSSRGVQKCPFRLPTLIIYLNALFAVRAPTPDSGSRDSHCSSSAKRKAQGSDRKP